MFHRRWRLWLSSYPKSKCWLKIAFWTYGQFRINTLLSTLVQLLHNILKCSYFKMTTVSFFLSKLLASLMRNCFPKRTSGAPLHTLSKLYDVPVSFISPLPCFAAVYCYIYGRQRVAVARYWMICLVLILICRCFKFFFYKYMSNY